MTPHRAALHGRIEPDLFPEFVVVSSHMRAVMKAVQQIARFDANVLIYGESGTGKELLARIVHQKSSRKDKPFVPVNCGTLSGELFESKLFGHEMGAFTGATKRTKGRFEQAHRGTLFLDEVSEISPPNQANFLRVLEDGCFRRIGGEIPTQVDVRIIAATNKNLAEEVEAGRFRKDLYYRLQVIPINLLPLRKRREAIPHLVKYFLERFSKIYQKEKITLSENAVNHLAEHDWPGNVRQLKNLMERLSLLAPKSVVDIDDFPEEFRSSLSPKEGPIALSPEETQKHLDDAQVPGGIEPLRKARQRIERTMIVRALQITKGRRAEAAELLEIKPRTLRQKMSDYEIKFQRAATADSATRDT
jgi:DNA-binding NtrC family response regulator